MSLFKNTFACIISALILIISFPQIEWWFLAWGALVPLLLAIDGKKPWAAFGWAYLCGFLFFAGTLGWFVYVTYPGAFCLIAYLSLYFALFGFAVAYFKPLPVLVRIFVLSSVWVVLEYTRSHFLSGFGWVTIGSSQLKNLWMIQIADITGVYGVSFVMVMVNLLGYEILKYVIPERFCRGSSNRSSRFPTKAFGNDSLRKSSLVVLAVLVAVASYGTFIIARSCFSTIVKVGIVQPNIPLSINWDASLHPAIVQKTIHLTKTLKGEHPDLIIWPETSLPGGLNENPHLVDQIQQTAKQLRTPLLIGAVTQEGEKYYNSALLVDSDGKIAGQYDKVHLVPFGEFLPLRPILGWINNFVPLDDFTPGTQFKIFPIAKQKNGFGVLICFEDTVSDVRRKFAKAGAQFFVNMTNDAWFEDTKAPFLHMQTAAFGCIENRRSLVRAANTGVSAVIDPHGRVIASVHNEEGKKSFITGTTIANVALSTQLTFYTKYGDIFTSLCFFVILGAVINRRKYV